MRSRFLLSLCIGLLVVIISLLAFSVDATEDIFEVAEHIAKLSPNCRIRVMEVVSERDFVKDLAESKLIDQSLHDSHREVHFKSLEEACPSEDERSLARKIYDTATFPLHRFFEYADTAKATLKDSSNRTYKTLMSLPAACRASTFNRLMSTQWIDKFKGRVNNFEEFSKRAANLAKDKFTSTCDKTYHEFYDKMSSGLESLKSTKNIVNPVSNFLGKFISSIQGAAINVKDQIKEDLGWERQYHPVHEPNVDYMHATITPERHTIGDLSRKAFGRVEEFVNGATENVKATVHEIRNSAERKYEEAHHPREFDRVRDITDDLHRGAQHVRDEVKEKEYQAKEMAQEAKDRINEFTSDLKEKGEELKEGAKHYANVAKEKIQEFGEEVKDKYSESKEKAQELKENAKSRLDDIIDRSKEQYNDTKEKLKEKFENSKRVLKNEPTVAPVSVQPTTEQPTTENLATQFRSWFDSFVSNIWAFVGVPALYTTIGVALYMYMNRTVTPSKAEDQVIVTQKDTLFVEENDRIDSDEAKRLEGLIRTVLVEVRKLNVTSNSTISGSDISAIRNDLGFLMEVLGDTLGEMSDKYSDVSQRLVKRAHENRNLAAEAKSVSES